MNERLPSDCLVMFCVEGLLVTTQVLVPPAPLIVSQTRVVPAIRWPQPVAAPAGPQSSPPGIPPWNRSNGRMKDCVSPVQAPRRLLYPAPPARQFEVQRLSPPLLLPTQYRRL